jgi:hypothetical protein
LRDRIRALLVLTTLLAAAAAPLPVLASTPPPPKVVIIVGPTGSVTSTYRSQADQVASVAAADGATVVKVYSPGATWANVKAAVAGANIIVYLGHGNGYPSPYSSTYYPDRVDGWGLNTATTNGDADSWSAGTLVYCGEKALVGALVSTDGANQWKYCGGSTNTDGISPAPGFVMIYSNACYAPGASEPGTTAATLTQAQQRVAYYSRQVITALGGSGYFATDHGAAPIVDAVLRNPDAAYGDIYRSKLPTGVAMTDYAHLLVGGAHTYLGKRSTDPYYTYAFAGDPSATFGGGAPMTLAAVDTTPPTIVSRWPAPKATGVTMTPAITVRFSENVSGVSAGNMVLRRGTTVVTSTVTYDPGTFTATLRPALPLAPYATYSMALSSRVRDAAGNALAWSSWTFTTAKTETYNPQRTLVFAAGTYTGYKFSSTGAVTARKSYTLSRASSAPTGKRSAIPAQSGGWYYVTAGVWAGYWIRESTAISLR